MRIVRGVLAAVALLTACRDPTAVHAPVTVDAWPFPRTAEVGRRIPLIPVLVDAEGTYHWDITNSHLGLVDSPGARLVGDTLEAWASGEAVLKIEGTHEGRALTGYRRVIVTPTPVR